MATKLLLIDDDARLTAMVGDYLRANGHEVDVAGSLALGRERLAQGQYDALVLDLMLPDGDGLDLTRTLRADPRFKRLPLLMLTARGEPLDRVLGLEMGAGYKLDSCWAGAPSGTRRRPALGDTIRHIGHRWDEVF